MTGDLGALIRAIAARAGARPMIEAVRSTPWASATFTGARHELQLRYCGKEAERRTAALCDGLDYAEFDLGRYILADIELVDRSADEGGISLTIDALTIEGD